MILFVLILLTAMYIIKLITNKDLVHDYGKDELDIANYKNARKYYAKTRTSIVVLIAAIALIIGLLLCDFTSIDASIIDYFSADFYTENELDRTLYYLPIYLYIIRLLVIEVKVGDYLYKYFKVDEPVLEENPLKSINVKNILYKKPKK